jgi:hypothetical protein
MPELRQAKSLNFYRSIEIIYENCLYMAASKISKLMFP